jgi:hypothetical protein
LKRNHYRIGIPTVVLSAIVGTTVFATLEKDVHIGVRVVVAGISLTVAILAALQTFLRFGERAELHRIASAKYESLSNEIRLLMSVPPLDVEKAKDALKRVGDLLAESPELAAVDRRAVGPNFYAG